jgi:CBS domain-containing protein
MRVEDLMTKTVWACVPTDTLNRAAQLLWEHDCGVVPVVDRDRVVVGMITDRDICMAAYMTGRPLTHVRVLDAMARRVHAVREGESIDHAQHVMAEFQVRRLPIVDAGHRLVGILSMTDLARRAHRSGLVAKGPTADGVARTLAAIGERHECGRGASNERAAASISAWDARRASALAR